MQQKIVSDASELAQVAATRIADAIRQKPDLVILAATGNTPVKTYERLAAMKPDTSRVRIVQLDEYVGLPPDDPRSLYGWMDRVLLRPLAIAADRVIRLDPRREDACEAFDHAVANAGGIDLAVLGLGANGHLGFNEPPSDTASPTRQVTLTEASLASNAAYWGGRELVPTAALTAGMPTILDAKQILLLVTGESKRSILRRVTTGRVSPDVPASYLQRCPQATVIADRAAAG
jgi:glucosamine-6-phosphate deaminase